MNREPMRPPEEVQHQWRTIIIRGVFLCEACSTTASEPTFSDVCPARERRKVADRRAK